MVARKRDAGSGSISRARGPSMTRDDQQQPPQDSAPAREVLSYQTAPGGGIKWVTVWKPRNTMEANLAVATLQERGIHARVDMENAADLGLPYAGVAYSKVQVLEPD